MQERVPMVTRKYRPFHNDRCESAILWQEKNSFASRAINMSSLRWFFICLVAFSSQPTTSLWADEAFAKSKPVPDWIWDEGGATSGQKIYLRTEFKIDGKKKAAPLYSTCDNRMVLWINGQRVAKTRDWMFPIDQDVSKFLVNGKNSIAIEAENDGGVAAFVLKLLVEQEGQEPLVVLSDESWSMSKSVPVGAWQGKDYDDSSWVGKVKKLKPLGSGPWGIPGVKKNASVTSIEDIQVQEGFEVELVHTVDSGVQGSWVSLTRGPDGKLIACDQGNKGAFWIQVTESSEGPQTVVTPIEINAPGSSNRLSGAQGLLWSDGVLWFHKNGGHLYRITDSDSDGQLDVVEEVPSQTGGGEHGNHAVIETEDSDAIYMAGGNHAPLAKLERSRVNSWGEDLLLPRMWDANGHARGRLAPGGWVTRLNPETLQQELVCIGFRNEYDIALNRHGDLFTYDADMEWDLGSPWYRPTRICQVVSGGDYGWRSGTGKWPAYYEDSLPPVVDIGPGSPTGVVAGRDASFPAKYRDALYALDWTFGTIYAITLEPRGAGYVGTSEPFVTGRPLPVTDAIVAADGMLYFTVGGRGAQSALYRVRYVGDELVADIEPKLSPQIAKAREQRLLFEQYHGQSLSGKEAERVIEMAWPVLQNDDRFLRSAARVAIESQPTELWSERVLQETSPQGVVTAAVALARSGDESNQEPLLDKLLLTEVDTDAQLLGWLRAVSLTCIRLGKPSEEQRSRLLQRIEPMLPDQNGDVNTELVKLLVYLRSDKVIEKAMALIADREPPSIPDWSELAGRNAGYGGTVQKVLDNHPPSREIGFALALRNLGQGWTIAQRRAYFEFLNEAAKKSGGSSYPGFIRNIRDEALATCSDAERIALQDITGENYDPIPNFEIKTVVGPGRVWTVDEARAKAGRNFRSASFENGRSVYFAANCGKCHRHNGLGGNVGPDLTTIPNKFDLNYVIDHIINPSKVISDQYQSSIVLTADGQTLTGLVSEADGEVIIYTADVNAEPIRLRADDVEALRPSAVSQMPKGLVDGLNPDELRDLLAYLMSGGDAKNRKVYGP